MHSIYLTITLAGALVLIILLEQFSISANERKKTRRRWPANFALFMIGTGLSLILPLSTTAAAVLAKSHGFGLISWLALPFAIDATFSVLMLSFTVYILHIAMHKIPLLWRLHQVHHSDYDMDVTTAYRTHPIAILVSMPIIFAAVYIFGPAAEAILIYSTIVFLIDLFHHSNLTWPVWLEANMRKIIITPSQHHIHHSNYQPETDSNYSVDLCIWDKMFGTYLADPIRDKKTFMYGLKQVPSKDADDLHVILSSPFKS
jgi:sterol desaturase/sphingolipid hydroxylase (fatty acid hydroxylase superfamily)